MMYANVLKVFAVAYASMATACSNCKHDEHKKHGVPANDHKHSASMDANPHAHSEDGIEFAHKVEDHMEGGEDFHGQHPDPAQEEFQPVTDEQFEEAKTALSLEEEHVEKVRALVEKFPEEFQASSMEEMTRGIIYNYHKHPQEGVEPSKEDLLHQLTELVEVQIPEWQAQMEGMGPEGMMPEGMDLEGMDMEAPKEDAAEPEAAEAEKVEEPAAEEQAEL